jgi:hypothetical protein
MVEVWGLTTDGAEFSALHQAASDQSSESNSLSPDPTHIVFVKTGMGSTKSDGVHAMDIASGVGSTSRRSPSRSTSCGRAKLKEASMCRRREKSRRW